MQSKRYTSRSSGSAASKFGQMIGEAFERVVIEFVRIYLEQQHSDYEILAPQEGKQLVTLQTLGGTERRLDTVIVYKESNDPIALLESKWLKDARHHNDKGAWILQLREVRKQYATVRGAAAILAGYWTEGVGVMLASNAGVRMVLVATDEEVYSTLQESLDAFLGEERFNLDAALMRKSYPNAHHLANFVLTLYERGELDQIARTWFDFIRGHVQNGTPITGGDKIRQAIDDLLHPLSANPRVAKFELALQIDTGNTIYQEFEDMESAMEFIKEYAENPEAILKRISPRKKSSDD